MSSTDNNIYDTAESYLIALGDKENIIKRIHCSCTTLLCIKVRNVANIDEDAIKAESMTKGAVEIGVSDYQIMVGPLAEKVADAMNVLMGRI